ncbi:MAG TPA: phosphocholine cytidylyltransferase family protein [Bryobacteraceae bacterium]|jgi:choline kinase|nr:phosphocholine cytidylyltransferase family protein [Bryobacteraceae bacterium]
MKAIILAAGQGTRIRDTHGEQPKCLIAFNRDNWTILDQQIHSLLLAGVTDIGIVVGYEKGRIIRHVSKRWGSLKRLIFIENPRFAETNNIHSLWLGRDWLKSDSFVALNADVALDSKILRPPLASNAPITMVVDRTWRDETMKVIILGNRIVRMSKQIARQEFSATYIGITVFDGSIVDRFFGKLDRLIRDGNNKIFFNAGVELLIEEGVWVGYTETAGRPWAKIDDAGDLAFARLYVFPKLVPADIAA